MIVKVLFFGIIADIAGCDQTSISNVVNTDDLKENLLQKFPDFAKYKYLISVNQEIIKDTKTLKNNDEIALLPPFAGG